jgi:hypothetical protein
MLLVEQQSPVISIRILPKQKLWSWKNASACDGINPYGINPYGPSRDEDPDLPYT